MVALQSDGTLTPAAVQQLFASATTCPYCGQNFERRDKTLDHVIALARGGKHSVRNALICCRSCNARKQAKELAQWLAEIGPILAAAVLRQIVARLERVGANAGSPTRPTALCPLGQRVPAAPF